MRFEIKEHKIFVFSFFCLGCGEWVSSNSEDGGYTTALPQR